MSIAPSSMRLACLDLTRVTEEMAILSYFLSGAGRANQIKTPRSSLLEHFFLALSNSIGATLRIGDFDPLAAGRVEAKRTGQLSKISDRVEKTLSKFSGGAFFGASSVSPNPSLPDWAPIDLVVQIISGYPDLIDGRFGAMAVLGGGVAPLCQAQQESNGSSVDGGKDSESTCPLTTDPFRIWRPAFPLGDPDPESPERVQRYLVLCTSNEGVLSKALGKLTRGQMDDCPTDFMNSSPLGRLSRNFLWNLSVATVRDDEGTRIREVLKGCTYRELSGSPVGASILAFDKSRHDFDVFVAVVRRSTAHLIAIAAQSVDGHAAFIQLRCEEPDVTPLFPNGCPEILKPCDFLATKDVFLIATGITSHPLLHGVKFKHDHGPLTSSVESHRSTSASFDDVDDSQDIVDDLLRRRASLPVSTHTYVLNGRSRTQRSIHHTRDLASDAFYPLVGDNADSSAGQIVDKFIESVRSAMQVRTMSPASTGGKRRKGRGRPPKPLH